jgi:hypothetical protein
MITSTLQYNSVCNISYLICLGIGITLIVYGLLYRGDLYAIIGCLICVISFILICIVGYFENKRNMEIEDPVIVIVELENPINIINKEKTKDNNDPINIV